MVMGLVFGLLLVVAVFLLVVSLIMLVPHKLTKKIRSTISKVGIMHFTTEEAAQKIIEVSTVKKSKKHRYTYFFQNGTVSENAIAHNNLENKEVRVEILNLTDEQLNKLKIRYFDMSVVNSGDFKISKENRVFVKMESDITPIQTNKRFYLGIAIMLAATGLIILIPLVTVIFVSLIRILIRIFSKQ